MNDFRQTIDANHCAVRHSLYNGALYLLPATAESTAFVANVWNSLEAEFQDVPPREAQFHFTSDDFFDRIGRLRKLFYTDNTFHQHVCAVMASVKFAPEEHGFDPVRLRTVTHDGHLNSAAQAIYYGHRDTWYSNPQAMITWWIPLHDVQSDETFEFFRSIWVYRG
jgi:hypothetical protein